jgi:hypothetical protein
LTELTLKVGGVLKPVFWLGILITAVVWSYVMYNDPLNIFGIVNRILLVILVVMNWYLGNKISNITFGKLPLKSFTLFIVLWLVFVYLALAII